MSEIPTGADNTHPVGYPLWVAYVAPMAAFLALTAAEGYAGRAYIPLYVAKVVVVSGLLVYFRATWQDMRPSARVIPAAVAVGLFVFAVWVLLDRWLAYPHLGSRTALNPFASIQSPAARAAFVAARLYGLVLVVPVMEELFWRSFLLRYITRPDFEALPIGVFSWMAFFVVAGLFGLAHPEWLAAVICAIAYGLLLRQTRSLFACVVAHAVSNLSLAVYVLLAHDWRYW